MWATSSSEGAICGITCSLTRLSSLSDASGSWRGDADERGLAGLLYRGARLSSSGDSTPPGVRAFNKVAHKLGGVIGDPGAAEHSLADLTHVETCNVSDPPGPSPALRTCTSPKRNIRSSAPVGLSCTRAPIGMRQPAAGTPTPPTADPLPLKWNSRRSTYPPLAIMTPLNTLR